MSEDDLSILEVDCEEIISRVKGYMVVISHDGKGDDVHDTVRVEPHVHIEEWLVADLFGQPHARVGIHIFLVRHRFDSHQKLRILEHVQRQLDV